MFSLNKTFKVFSILFFQISSIRLNTPNIPHQLHIDTLQFWCNFHQENLIYLMPHDDFQYVVYCAFILIQHTLDYYSVYRSCNKHFKPWKVQRFFLFPNRNKLLQSRLIWSHAKVLVTRYCSRKVGSMVWWIDSGANYLGLDDRICLVRHFSNAKLLRVVNNEISFHSRQNSSNLC